MAVHSICQPGKPVPQGHPRFYQLLEEMRRVHDAKNHDYAGNRADPLANFRECEKLGLPAWKGVVVRMTDKLARLASFAKQGELKVKSEGICDTLLDLANYALLCRILVEEAGAPKVGSDGENR